MFFARFDGGCWPNPKGHAACACAITRDGKEVWRETKYLGFGDGMTNNVAEFNGALLVLRWFNNEMWKSDHITIVGDSRLVINRLDKWRAKGSEGVCRQVSIDCLEASVWHRKRITFKWQPREHNDECDAMCAEMITMQKYNLDVAAQKADWLRAIAKEER